jgi:hypothetical protein
MYIFKIKHFSGVVAEVAAESFYDAMLFLGWKGDHVTVVSDRQVSAVVLKMDQDANFKEVWRRFVNNGAKLEQ